MLSFTKIIGIFLLLFFPLFNSFSNKIKLKSHVELNYPSKYNYRQDYNNCGPYSLKAFIYMASLKEVTITEILPKLKSRWKNNYSMPWGMEKVLKSYGLKVDTPAFIFKNDKSKIMLLKQYLAAGSPVIILIGLGKYQHYITLTGYSNDMFYVYDSLQIKSKESNAYTVDGNGEFPGNKNINKDELLRLWKKGGMYGLYKFYGITLKRIKPES